MIGITAIGSAVGQEKIDNIARCGEFNRSKDFIVEKIGFTKLCRIGTGIDTANLCEQAYANLQERHPFPIEDVGVLVVITQNPEARGLPHTSVIVQDRLGLGPVAAFDVSLGCSGYVYGLSIIKSFMEANGISKGLLFTADPYSKVINPKDMVTELLFGDAATCTLLTDAPKYGIGKTVFNSDGSKHAMLTIQSENSTLFMDGRAIFNFTMRKVPVQIKECLTKNSMSIEDVDLFILHQASKYIVDNMAKRLGLPSKKTPFALGEIGNTVSSTIPMTLDLYLGAKPESVLLSGFGVGLSWATTILTKRK